MNRMLHVLLVLAAAQGARAGQNLVRNGGFESDIDRNGVPDHWARAGDEAVAQKLSSDKGREGGFCARLTCTKFRSVSGASHAMICQLGSAVRRGRTYRITFHARAEDIAADIVSVALRDTKEWAECGLRDSFVPTEKWTRYEFIFTALRDCAAASRLQFWFASTGTLWLDDVELTETEGPARRPGHVLPPGKRKNLVPNASFECGPSGWGSAEWDRITHWGGKMNRLFGAVDSSTVFRGRRSLRISLSPDNQPVSSFDYFDLYRVEIRAPLAASIGFIEIEPDREYTLSVYLKADTDGVPTRLAVRRFGGGDVERLLRVKSTWQRYALTFQRPWRWCYVLVGPDLRITDETPSPPKAATLWIDAVQLEKSARPTAFASREEIEFAVATDKTGNVFDGSEPVVARVTVANCAKQKRDATVRLELTDFFDRPAWRGEVKLTLLPGGAAVQAVRIAPKTPLRGYYRLTAKLAAGPIASQQSLRLAVIPLCKADDSRFGVNHAYAWDHLLDLSRAAGLVWVRDWSLKWQDVEPARGRFTFTEPDLQIDRPLARKLRVLCMLPFPSAPWSSTAPDAEKAKAAGSYVARRAVIARAPRDLKEFETYVENAAKHTRGRVTWLQVFNEPLFTSYSLPRKHGYDGATYAKYVQAFARAAKRGNPKCRILAGIGALNPGQIMKDFEQFFAAGGLEVIDAVDIHQYPRLRGPEYIEPLLAELNALMDRHGRRLPMWMTEYGYYADDEPSAVPMPHLGHDPPLPSESVQAAYAVRWAAILLANGVEKIFYHAGSCDGVNQDMLQGIFYEYAGQPHKIYAAQAVMSHLLTPTTRFARKLSLGEGVRGYLFQDGKRCVAVVWAGKGAKPRAVSLDAKLVLWDIMGRPQEVKQFTPDGTPVYVIGEGLTPEKFAAALR